MNLKEFFGFTKRKFLLFIILAVIFNFVLLWPLGGTLEVETIDGGYTVYAFGFPFHSNFVSSTAWNWNIYGLLGNLLVAYFISCLISL